ncbi:MAG: methylmalonyl Co-A mutase-associated GTPase MeaB [Actinomycetales bacterium]|nr:methylmalonyl Co-A mutase-associated GTPase MeaB [Actinomycetales bacterium]
MSPRQFDVTDLVSRAAAGETRYIARLITLVESESEQLRELSALLAPRTGRAHVIGLTGSPGVGKSTTTSALVTEFRKRGKTVGVLAVDPSSPFSGGALLGDRIRMQEHSMDPGVFIRSMASRGHLGGLSWATPHAIRVLDAAGFDVILAETVGVGQSEIEVSQLADTSLVLLAPGMGDGIQAAKAGILEIGDIFCINKADRDGAEATRRELRNGLSMTARADSWKPPIEMTIATEGTGIDKIADHIADHKDHLDATGMLQARREERASREIQAIAVAEIMRGFDVSGGQLLAGLSDRVASGRLDPFTAADELRKTTDSM